jgi:hypothetical protein
VAPSARRDRALGTVAALLAAASSAGDTPAITRVLVHSTHTYLHYRDTSWWGRSVDVRLALLRVDGPYAVVEIRAGSRAQWVFLQRTHGWQIREIVHRGVFLRCRLAPPAVMRDLVGGCVYGKPISYASWVGGPRDRRPATAAEVRAIRCGQSAEVSRVDPSYAGARCAYLEWLYHRGPHGWRRVTVASDGPECSKAPPGVARSLFGGCWTD